MSATKNSDLYYSSEWDIDQLIIQDTVSGIVLAASTTTPTSVVLKNVNYSYPPVIDGAWQLSTDTVWRQFGDPTSAGIINLQTFIACTPNNVSFVYYNFDIVPYTVNVRYYVWTDKINYGT